MSTSANKPELSRALLDWLTRIEGAVATLAFALMVVIAAADVLMREVTGQGLDGAREAAVLLMVVLVMAGFGLATAGSRQLRPRFTDNLVPERWQPGVIRFGDLLTALIYLLLAVLGAILVGESIRLGELTPVLRLPSALVQSVLPLAFTIGIIRHLLFFWRPGLRPGDDLGALVAKPSRGP